MVIVDTTVWVDYLRGETNAETEWLNRELPLKRIGLTDLILSEVLQGLRNEDELHHVLRRLSECEIFNSGGEPTAVEAARNFMFLRGRGYTIRKTIDCWIATFCIREGFSLLHRDRDFDVFEQHLGLRVIHP